MNLIESDEAELFFKNCLSIARDRDALVPLRFTPSQLEVYGREKAFRIRSISPAGVYIDCETDSPWMDITFFSRGGCREWMYFDLVVNSMLVSHSGWDRFPGAEQTIRLEVPEYLRGQNRLSVYLPYNMHTAIRSIETADGSETVPIPSHGKKLLCMGDSITQGMDALHPSNTYPVQTARMLGMNLLNQGVGGHVFQTETLDNTIGLKPDVVTVAYGTNDWNRYASISEFRSMCEEYINRLSFIFSACPILVLTPLWRSDIDEDKPMGSFELLKDTIYEVCSGIDNISVVNGLKLTPHIPEYYRDKTIHPDDTGFLHYAVNLADICRKYV